MTQPKYYAVLTGDIVKSSRLRPNQLESVRASLRKAVEVTRAWKPGLVRGQPEFFRGDAWQLLLADAAMAMRVAIFLRATLLAKGLADTRIAIGLGEVEKVSSARISLSMGPAFSLSGHALDRMTQYSSMTIEIPKSLGALSNWLPVVGHLCDSLIVQWTSRQAEIIRAAIDPKEPDHEKVAQTLKPAITKQAVAKALSGANWHTLREAVRLFETTSWKAILRPKKADNQKRLSLPRQPKKVV